MSDSDEATKTPDRPGDAAAPAAIPPQVRLLGAIAALQGGAGLVFAAVLVYRDLVQHHTERDVSISGLGTSVWFLLIGGAVFAAGVALVTGRRWGRGIAMMAQILLLPVAYYLATSGKWIVAVPVLVVALVGLFGVFHPRSVAWFAESYGS